jgi:hypothetical protein
MNTFHATPERSSPEVVQGQHLKLIRNDYFSELINALPYVVTVLNENRQIVFSNKVLTDSLKVSEFRELLGKRPGEALSCIHSKTMEGGCGTSESCRACGAVNAITTSIKENRKVVNECRITTEIEDVEEFYDYEVTASPFNWEGERFTIFSVADISGIKRKRMLERIFFHDILNTAGNMKNISELIPQLNDQAKKDELLVLLGRVSNELVEEITEQRQLASAETGDLNLNYSMVKTSEIIHILISQFESHLKIPVKFNIAEDSQDLGFSSDKSILTRILKNMIKNALEASSGGDTITISVKLAGTLVRFIVHNPNFIPRNIQLQIFKRSFSTKGHDRGLGTYSMKLLGERFLKGRVYFTSDEKTGTQFYFDLPLN